MRPPPACADEELMEDQCRLTSLARGAPIVPHDRVEHLVEIFPVAPERLAQHAFLHGTHFLKRATAAPVSHCGACFETMNAEREEDELQNQLRTLGEDARAPERRPKREAPLCGLKIRFGLANLKHADRRVAPFQRDRVTDVLPAPLPIRLLDEALEGIDARRRRRDKPRDFW